MIPYINTGDKEISFDGTISVLINDSDKKESLMGPVQVKGTVVDNFHDSVRPYSLEMAHYKNFLNSFDFKKISSLRGDSRDQIKASASSVNRLNVKMELRVSKNTLSRSTLRILPSCIHPSLVQMRTLWFMHRMQL